MVSAVQDDRGGARPRRRAGQQRRLRRVRHHRGDRPRQRADHVRDQRLRPLPAHPARAARRCARPRRAGSSTSARWVAASPSPSAVTTTRRSTPSRPSATPCATRSAGSASGSASSSPASSAPKFDSTALSSEAAVAQDALAVCRAGRRQRQQHHRRLRQPAGLRRPGGGRQGHAPRHRVAPPQAPVCRDTGSARPHRRADPGRRPVLGPHGAGPVQHLTACRDASTSPRPRTT